MPASGKKKKKKPKRKKANINNDLLVNSTPNHPDEDSVVEKEEGWLERKEKEIAMCESVAGSWLAFSFAKARPIPFSVDPKIKRLFEQVPTGQTKSAMGKWVIDAEASILNWVVDSVLLGDVVLNGDKADQEPMTTCYPKQTKRISSSSSSKSKVRRRIDQFKALGRGWILVDIYCRELREGGSLCCLKNRQNSFRVWFESIERIQKDHKLDIRNLNADTLERYTNGYAHDYELVILVKYLGVCTISIRKLRPDYRKFDHFAKQAQPCPKSRDWALPTVEERQEQSKAIKAARNKREKKKKRRKEKKLKQRNAAILALRGLLSGRGSLSLQHLSKSENPQTMLDGIVGCLARLKNFGVGTVKEFDKRTGTLQISLNDWVLSDNSSPQLYTCPPSYPSLVSIVTKKEQREENEAETTSTLFEKMLANMKNVV